MRDHFGVAQDRRTAFNRRGSGAATTGRKNQVAGDLNHAAGMNDAHSDTLLDGLKTRQIGLATDHWRTNADRFRHRPGYSQASLATQRVPPHDV